MLADVGPITQLGVGGTHVCVVTVNGVLRCEGNNRYGQVSIPLTLGTVTQVSAGSAHNCAMKPNRTLGCWGANGSGEATVPLDPLDTSSAPIVVAITRAEPNPTSAASVAFTVTFAKAVTGVDPSNFTLTTTGNLWGSQVIDVTGGPAFYTVVVNTGSGRSTLRLDVKSSGTGITDLNGTPLAEGFTNGQSYTIERVGQGAPPTIHLPLIMR
ncbi:hypothetical protein [Chloroflexus sp.]|uniref:hypothetical protein n=1 Tax=Chloroflexus sp. TaxID=1904827 RepID=UPI00263A2444|nr:hypothetical protein [uncultured Chloroflexus sp.]